jgi:hypothetical protein
MRNIIHKFDYLPLISVRGIDRGRNSGLGCKEPGLGCEGPGLGCEGSGLVC